MAQFIYASQLLFIGTTELLLISGIALLLFGGKKLPEMMRGLGQGVREFKKGVNETKDELSGNIEKAEEIKEGQSQENGTSKECQHSNRELKANE